MRFFVLTTLVALAVAAPVRMMIPADGMMPDNVEMRHRDTMTHAEKEDMVENHIMDNMKRSMTMKENHIMDNVKRSMTMNEKENMMDKHVMEDTMDTDTNNAMGREMGTQKREMMPKEKLMKGMMDADTEIVHSKRDMATKGVDMHANTDTNKAMGMEMETQKREVMPKEKLMKGMMDDGMHSKRGMMTKGEGMQAEKEGMMGAGMGMEKRDGMMKGEMGMEKGMMDEGM